MGNGLSEEQSGPKLGAAERTLLDLRQHLIDAPVRPPLQGTATAPAEDVPGELALIARRIRRWREEAGHTLQALARRSGVAASTIQKIETQQMVPTVTVLFKIARGLERAPTELISDGADEALVVHLSRAQRHPIGERSGMLCERLVGDLFEPTLEAWRLTHAPGSGSGRQPLRHEGEKLAIGETGEMRFDVGGRQYTLREGDILHFKCTLLHGWRNVGTGSASFLLIGTLPRVTRAWLHEQLRAADQGSASS